MDARLCIRRCARWAALAVMAAPFAFGAPGSADNPVQMIDVRDLGEWPVGPAEDGTMGVYTAAGPAGPPKWGDLANACVEASSAAPRPRAVWVNSDAVTRAGALGRYPIWLAPVGGHAGFRTWSDERAMKAGLRFRPVSDTARDALAWHLEQEKVEGGRTGLAAPSAETEAKVPEAFKKGLPDSLAQLLAG